ncbi:alpha/beta hydrolase [Amorphoplanes nipponensis]|uniref:Alpha/beta hydrolase n=1 Tax=Actinoplanes nipponensis TaxID=135950 RepID=A0A919JM64_9ACTN|nr:alpha/beta hydrolase [Actinoplanes nipponensis]GIE51721.1 alpha/beta hydrolase [Actinoplanes nipponensis]
MTADAGQSGYVELPAGRFHYRRWAAGPEAPSVILVHGNGSSSATWSRVAPALHAAGLHVLAPDLRGSGASVRPPVGSYGLPEVAADLHDFIDALRLPAPLLIGHCWGAAVALTLATGASGGRVPPALSGLVLEELPSDMAATEDQPVVRDFLRMMRGSREYARSWVDLICRSWHPADRESLLADAWGTDVDVYLSVIKDGAGAGPLLPHLARLELPALVLRGNPRRGSMLSDGDWQLTRRLLPGHCAAYEFSDSGHEVHRSDCAGYLRLVEDFLHATVRPGRPGLPSTLRG